MYAARRFSCPSFFHTSTNRRMYKLLSNGLLTPLTQKVTLAVWPTWRRTAVLWGARWDWDTVANGDGVVSHQDVFDYESYDSLALRDVQRLGSTAQAGEERRESLRQSQEGCPIVGLVSDRLQLSTKHLFTLAQRRHALAQLLDRQERFLVGVEKSFHAFANMRQLPLQTLLTFLGRIARACGCQPAVQFLLEQRRVFQQSDHLRPNDLIEEILSDQAAVVANRTAKFSPAIGTNTFVVVDLARARACRYAREGVAALLTADQPLHDTRLDGATARSYFVLLEKLLGTSEAILAYQGGHGDLDPLFARALVACCRAGRHHTPPTQRALALRVGMPSALIRRVISPMLSPSTVYISYTRCTTRASASSTVYAAGASSVLRT